MATCDVCGAPASRTKNPTYPAETMRQLVANGFRLDESSIGKLALGEAVPREQAIAQWEQKVAQATTDWLLCPDCAARATKYRQPPGVAKSRWWLVGMLIGLGALAGLAILIVRAPKSEARSLRDSLGGVATTSVAFSPDGQILATGRDDLTIKLWDVATGEEVHTLSGHTSRVSAVAFSPDGQLLASASNERAVRLWNVSTWQEARIILGEHAMGITSVALSPDGQLLASGSHDNLIKLWNVATGQEVRTLTGHTGSVTSVAFSPDGPILASGSNDRTIRLWDVSTALDPGAATSQEARALLTLTGHARWVHCVAFSPDGQTLASGSEDGAIKLWHVATGQEIRTLSGHEKSVSGVAFSPDGRVLASGSDDGTTKLWSVLTGQEICTLGGHEEYRVTSVAFSPNGLLLASGSTFDTKLWDIEKYYNSD